MHAYATRDTVTAITMALGARDQTLRQLNHRDRRSGQLGGQDCGVCSNGDKPAQARLVEDFDQELDESLFDGRYGQRGPL